MNRRDPAERAPEAYKVDEGGGRILIVDDDEAIREMIRYPLEQDGFEVVLAVDGSQALALLQQTAVDLVVLDIMLPGLSGIEVCRRVRAVSAVPIIMLTARSDELDRVLGLEMGADDYVVKENLSLRELTSRVRAVLRRTRPAAAGRLAAAGVIREGELEVDLGRRVVVRGGQRVELGHYEFELLRVMIQHPGRVYSRALLLQLIWGDGDYRDERTVDVHVHYLRDAVEQDPRRPILIQTVRHVGYRFREREK
jgi:DNA-binding response OmpR family regulator